jgi:hypothetical protein
MDRRDFVALLGSIPFLNKVSIETLPDKDVAKVQSIDETTRLVIGKAQSIIEGFLTGFKNIKFTLQSGCGASTPLVVESYTVNNGIASISFKEVKINEKTAPYRNGAIITATCGEYYIGSYNLKVSANKDDNLIINLTLSIAC